MKLYVNTACCERCWINREGVWELDDSGNERLTGIRMPVRLKGDPFEVDGCGFCGEPTFVGIYVRAHRDEAPYHEDE